MMNTRLSAKAHINRLLRDRGGNFGIMTAIMMPVLIGAAGVSIEVADMLLSKQQLQEAVDSAALATATALASGKATNEDQAKALAKNFVVGQMANYVDQTITDEMSSSTNVNINTTTLSGGKSYKITVDTSYPLTLSPLMSVLGYKTVNIAAASTTTSGISEERSAVSMTLVLDESGSMLADTGTLDTTQTSCVQYNDNGVQRIEYDSRGREITKFSPCYIKKIDALKTASNLLLGELDKADPSTPAQYVRTNAIAWSNKVKITSDFAWGTSNTRTKVINKLSAGNGTESYAPMKKAYEGLSGDSSTSESGIQRTAGNTKLTKYIVFMTDGNNNDTSSDKNTRTVCTNAKNDGMKIYSIAFMAPPRGQQLLEDCASGAGYYFKAESMNDLLSAFQKIGQDAAANKTLLTQ